MDDLIKRLEAAEAGSRRQPMLQALQDASEADTDRCLFAPGATDERGRKRVWQGGNLKLAHRIVWEMRNGPIPQGKMICHHCDNGGCLNIKHMYVGTHADNMRDMRVRKRSAFHQYPEKMREVARRAGRQNTHCRGEGNPKAKLSESDVIAICGSTKPTKQLAAQYGVNRTTIQRIRRGSGWTALKARQHG